MTAGTSRLRGRTVGVTAVRKADEQISMFRRRGAHVLWAPALAQSPPVLDSDYLCAVTAEVISAPVDLFIATTGVGMTAWFQMAETWGLYEDLVRAIGKAEILARGPKSVGALRRHGLRESWSPVSERLADVLDRLSRRDLSGKRIILQEHGESLGDAAASLRACGAQVTVVTIYRIGRPPDPARLRRLIVSNIDRQVDAVTFTSAPAVNSFMAAADDIGLWDETIAALQDRILVACVGPVAADAFGLWRIPTAVPFRFRLGALVKLVEDHLTTLT